MDDSPEPTKILGIMKELNNFIGYGNNKKTESLGLLASQTPRQKLNFSDDDSELTDDKFNTSLSFSKKRRLNDLTGLDVVKKFREKEVDLVDAKATISKLESRVRSLDEANKRAKLDYNVEIEALQKKQFRDKELIDDLQHKIKKLEAKEREKIDHRYSSIANKDAQIAELENKCLMVQNKYREISNKYEEETTELNEKIFNYEKELIEKSAKFDLIEERNQELELHLATVKRKLRDSGQFQANSDLLTTELESAKAKIKLLEIYEEEVKEYRKQEDLLASEIKKNRELDVEVVKLRDDVKFYRQTVANTQLLEEQLKSAELKNNLLEKRVEHLNDIHSRCDDQKVKLKEMECVVIKEFELPEMIPVSDFKQRLAILKKSDSDVSNSLIELRASLQSIETSKNIVEQENKNLLSQLDQQKTSLQTNQHLIKRLQRRIMLVSKERDSLKGIINSYESEVTMNPTLLGQQRILTLEQQLSQYKTEMSKLEVELDHLQGLNKDEDGGSSRVEDLEKIEKLEAKITELEAQVKKLEQEKEVLEDRIEEGALKGDYNPAETKILHLVNNPYDEAVKSRQLTEEQLRKEVMALKERIRLMQEGDQLNITERVGAKVNEDAPVAKEVKELKEKLQSQEKQAERLLSVFRKKSLQMREIVYYLTGYRFDGKGETKYKVTSMYADSPEDYLLFEIHDNGDVEFLQTDYANNIKDLIQSHLNRQQSYPTLFAALTFRLFNQQTKVEEPSSSEQEEDDEEDQMDQDSEEEMYPPGEEDQEMQEEHPPPHSDEGESMSGRTSPPQGEEEFEEEEEVEEEEEEEEGGYAEEDELICLD